LGSAHEQFQCALAAVQAQQKPSCKPEKINTTSIWYPLDAPNSWIFATTQEVTLTYVCGEERRKIQVHNNGIVTMNADCIARSPVVTLQGHPALRSTIEKKTGDNYYTFVQETNTGEASRHDHTKQFNEQPKSSAGRSPSTSGAARQRGFGGQSPLQQGS